MTCAQIYMSEEKSTPFPNCKHFTPHVAPHYFVTELASPDSSAYAATPWTMVYDEGFNFVRKVNGQNLALFGFNKWKKISDTMEESFCGLTQRGLGWYHNGLGIGAPTKWGCFAGVKEHQPDPIKWDLKPDLLVSRDDGVRGVTVAQVEDEDEDEDYDEDEDEDGDYVYDPEEEDEDGEDDNTFSGDDDEDEPRPAPVLATSPDGLKNHVLQRVTDDDLSKYEAETRTVRPSTERTVFRHAGEEVRDGASAVVLDEEHWNREVKAINSNSKHWKARVYPDLFVNKTRREIELMTGGRMHHGFSELSRVASPFASVEANRGRPIDADVLVQGVNDVDVPDGVPAKWDWRDVNGKNFDSEVRQQGSCGSCFTIATVTALEARVKILTRGEWAPMLSPQQQLSCSNGNYAQGCDGGFPFLLAKHIHDYGGIAEDECAPYTAETGDCPEHCKAKNVVTAKNFGYVGGLYGACTVQDMMTEVYNHGPIPVAFEVGSAFMSYDSGVFDHHLHSAKKRRKDGVWQITDHAVVLVGWSTETTGDEPPYWIIRNSWGTNWGEDGYIRIAMNRDLMHIESMAVTLDPHILHPEYAHYNHDRHAGGQTPVEALLA